LGQEPTRSALPAYARYRHNAGGRCDSRSSLVL